MELRAGFFRSERMSMSIASGFLALACASTLSAAVETHDVSFDGSMEYTSIQDAIDAASDGDIIYIHPGYYQEALNTNGKNVSLHGKVDEDEGNWPVLYGPGNGKSILTVANGETQEMEVSSLVFFGGFSGWGPAVNIFEARLMILRGGVNTPVVNSGVTNPGRLRSKSRRTTVWSSGPVSFGVNACL